MRETDLRNSLGTPPMSPGVVGIPSCPASSTMCSETKHASGGYLIAHRTHTREIGAPADLDVEIPGLGKERTFAAVQVNLVYILFLVGVPIPQF